MSIEGLVNELEQSGVRFRMDGNRVFFQPPAGHWLSPDMVQALRRQKPAVIRYLRARAVKSVEEEMSREPDAFWRASEVAWKRLGELQHQDLPKAMAWLRQSQPVAYRQLTQDSLERISFLWGLRELAAFQQALDTWIVGHLEVCKIYQLVRLLPPRGGNIPESCAD